MTGSTIAGRGLLRLIVGAALLIGTPTALAAWSASSPRAVAAADVLPDLGVARLGGFRIEQTMDGRHLFRYTTKAVNVGRGALGLPGDPAANNAWQRIFDDAGGYRDVLTPYQFAFAGDGHNHWHILDFEKAELVRLDNGSKVGTSGKRGFCLFDNYEHNLALPGAPPSAVYKGCLVNAGKTNMGISVGWGDKYGAGLPDQFIDITGLTPGRYRLDVTADAPNWLAESNEGNNTAWAELQLNGNGTFNVIRKGGHV